MKKSVILITVAILALSLAACSQQSGTSGATSSPSTAPTGQSVPTTETVWSDTISNNAYKSWATAPGYETTQAARGPHGKAVQVYVSPVVSTTLSGSAATTWPVGSMIVKDAYDANNQLIQIEYMEKTAQGWYFASFGVDGTVVKSGVKVAPCEPCHSKNSADGVKSFKLPQ